MAVRVVRPSHWYKLKGAGDNTPNRASTNVPAPSPSVTPVTDVSASSPLAPPDDGGFCGVQRAGDGNVDAETWIKQLPTPSPLKQAPPAPPPEEHVAAEEGVSMLDALLAKLAVAPGSNGFKCVLV